MQAWLDTLLAALALPHYGLSTLFVASFISATQLPLGSEPALFGLIKLNPDLLWSAVENIVRNAVKHGGATKVQLSAVSSRAGVEIAVDDNGSGVPESERQVVFERFSRGSTASHSGSGLGLALVAQQAELHGGTASLEDSPLGGVRLLLRLPGPS